MRGRRAWLALEVVLLLTAAPAALYAWRREVAMAIIPLLLVVGPACLLWLLLDRSFDRRRLWLGGNVRRDLRTIGLAFVPLAGMVGVAFWLVEPGRLFALVREDVRLWAMIMVLYPLFSAYPQEVIFRTFLFHRYRALLGEGWGMIVVSGVVFGLAHVVLANWVAVGLSTCGGLLFAWTYARSRSTLMAAIEHGLWGDFVFTIGLGWWFYGGYVMQG